MTKTGRKLGRPRRAGVLANKTLLIRLTPGEHAELQRLAKTEGLSVGALIRKYTLAAKGSAQQGYFAKHGRDFPGIEDQAELEKRGQLRIDVVGS